MQARFILLKVSLVIVINLEMKSIHQMFCSSNSKTTPKKTTM